MKLKVNTFLLIFIVASCGKKLHVKEENYRWKSHNKIMDQTVDLTQYKSPNTRPGQNSDQLVIVCASGGGARAASFTIGCLLELENILIKANGNSIDLQRNVTNEIDYFSTVSGGGWGAGAFISYKYQNNKYADRFKDNTIKNYSTFNAYEIWLAHWADRRYARYQLSYFLTGNTRASGDVMMDRLNSGYLGWIYRVLKEDTIWQKSLVSKGADGKSIRFDTENVDEIRLSDVFTLKTSKQEPKLPMLIANSTSIDNYEVVPFTPDRLKFWGVRQYRYSTRYGAKNNPEKLGDVLPLDSLLNIPLAAGIKASSSVNSFIGASSFPAKRQGIEYHLHLEDGGVLDNLGLHTAKAILKQDTVVKAKSKRIVIIIDASSCGITNGKGLKKKNVGRLYSAGRISPPLVPDVHYPLSRESMQDMEKEYNCTVIYLGSEVLLDTILGLKGSVSPNYSVKQKKAEGNFYEIYNNMLKTPEYFLKNVSIQDRRTLYAYIEKNLKTWFTAKKSVNGGIELTAPTDTKGYAKVMFLAGRGVVQLKREEIISKFTVK